jgi:hypothetical protein
LLKIPQGISSLQRLWEKILAKAWTRRGGVSPGRVRLLFLEVARDVLRIVRLAVVLHDALCGAVRHRGREAGGGNRYGFLAAADDFLFLRDIQIGDGFFVDAQTVQFLAF